MKIVVTVHTYWPERNGVQYVTQYLCEGLVAKGHDVTVITPVSKKGDEREEIHKGVRLVRTYLKTKYSFINFGVSHYKKLVIAEVGDADILINCCIQAPNNNVLLPVLKEITAFKMLYMHGMHSFNLKKDGCDIKYRLWHMFMNMRWKLFYSSNRKNFNQYDALVDIHSSSPAIEYLKKLGVGAAPYIITNAVEDFDLVTIDDETMQKYPVLNERYLLNVSNFTSRKNQLMLVDSFGKVKKRNDVKLVLIGKSSSYCSVLRKRVYELGLDDDILIFENQEREVTRKFIKNCFFGVMSSRYEVYPIFLCEIISCGHPYISTDVGCVRDIPGGVVVNSAEELVEEIERMIVDEAYRSDLGRRGKEFANTNLSQLSKVEQLEGVLQKAVSCRQTVSLVEKE